MDWIRENTSGFISMKNDAHQRPFNGTGAWLRMEPERRVERCGPGRVVAGGISRGQDLQKNPQLSLGDKSDLQSVPESTGPCPGVTIMKVDKAAASSSGKRGNQKAPSSPHCLMDPKCFGTC